MPCPFCGGKTSVTTLAADPPDIPQLTWIVQCRRTNGCDCWPQAFGDTFQEALDKWNTRGGVLHSTAGIQALARSGVNITFKAHLEHTMAAFDLGLKRGMSLQRAMGTMSELIERLNSGACHRTALIRYHHRGPRALLGEVAT